MDGASKAARGNGPWLLPYADGLVLTPRKRGGDAVFNKWIDEGNGGERFEQDL